MSREVQDALALARVVLKFDALERQRAAAAMHENAAFWIERGNEPLAVTVQGIRESSARSARESYQAWTVLCRERDRLDQAVAS